MAELNAENNRLLSSNDIAKSFLTFILGLISTAIGFFLALHFNGQQDDKKERESFANIQKAIVSECNYNKDILDNTFKRLDDSSRFPVFNTLITNFTSQQSQSVTFIKYADPDLLNAIQNYIRLCELANIQKDSIVLLRTVSDKMDRLHQYKGAIHNTIQQIEESIEIMVQKK